jgi:alpha-D-xyloside xylohydrolase
MHKAIKNVTAVDFSNPTAAKWYGEKHLVNLRLGADVFKPDYGDWAPINAKYYNGMDGNQMHNLYPPLYTKTVFDVTKKYSGRGVVWGRPGYAGIQKYPLQWGGDSQTSYGGLANTIKGGLSYGLSGVAFWSNDIGGFIGPKPTPELYLRWAQFGMFCSHARCHGTSEREPYEYGSKVVKIFRDFVNLRYRLLPYTYSCAYQSTKTGLPIMRALAFDYQDDPNVYHQDLEYMFGESLLIAPIYNETNERNVYLPSGTWYDYWTQKKYTGPINLKYRAKLEIIPVFVKSDSIIVYGEPREFITDKPEQKLLIDVYLETQTRFTYKDDHETIILSGTRDAHNIRLTATKPVHEKEYTFMFNNAGKPKSVIVNGKQTKNYKTTGNKIEVNLVTTKPAVITIRY